MFFFIFQLMARGRYRNVRHRTVEILNVNLWGLLVAIHQKQVRIFQDIKYKIVYFFFRIRDRSLAGKTKGITTSISRNSLQLESTRRVGLK